MEKYKPPIIIDEIQYAPDLMIYIKILVDKDRKNGQFWLTGSQKFNLMKEISESLAGRIAIIDLLGLSQKEISKESQNSKPFLPLNKYKNFRSLGLSAVYKQIWKGSYPELYRKKGMDWNQFYSSYLQTYLKRDIRDLSQVADEQVFLKFLRVIAARTGQLLNYSEVANDISVSVNTVKNWISLLETSGIIFLLHPYYTNLTKRIIKTPKLYFLDTGLVAYLLGWENEKVLERGAMNGAFFETYVVIEIIKSYWHNGKSLLNCRTHREMTHFTLVCKDKKIVKVPRGPSERRERLRSGF